MAKVTMPQLGESVAEGTIGKWLKQLGDHVARDEPLLEVITDKVNAEVPSPFEGVLTEILVQEGETVSNNTEIAVIAEATGESASARSAAARAPTALPPAAANASPAPDQTATTARPAATTQPVADPQRAAASDTTSSAATPAAASAVTWPEPPIGREAPEGAQETAAGRMSPSVRRLVREHGIAPGQLRGTGGGGRISRDDVLAFIAVRTTTGAPPSEADRRAGRGTPAAPAGAPAARSASPPPSRPAIRQPASPPLEFEPGVDELLIPWSQMRRGIATAMVRSKTTVPHASTTLEVDATNLVRLRAAHKESFRAREGANLSYVPFIVKAVVEALRRHPKLNAHWTEAGLLVKRRINVGIAVAVEEGLIVPVIHDADQLSISGVNRAVLDLAERARIGRFRLDDLQGGTITINNTGTFGSLVSNSIINTPEVAIINLEAIVKRPVVIETPEGDVIAIRSMMNLPVVFDHRATDGAQAGRFAADIKDWIETLGPETPIY